MTLDRLDRQVYRLSMEQLNRSAALAKKAGVKAAVVLRDGDRT